MFAFLCNINSYSRLLVLANIHTLFLRLIETAPIGHTKSSSIRSLSSLCCDVASRSTLINRCGAIEKLISLLRDENLENLHHKIVDGLHWFVHDQEALQTMIQKYDLIIALAGYLDKLVDRLENSVNFANISTNNYNDSSAGFTQEREQTRFHPVLSSSFLSPISPESGCSTSSTPIHSSDMSTSKNIIDSDNDNISDGHGITITLNLLKSICRLSHRHHVNVVRFCMKGLLGCIVKDSENRVDAYKVILLIIQNKCCLKVILHHCIPWLIYQFLMTGREIKLSSHTFVIFAKYCLKDESLEEHWNLSKNSQEETMLASELISLLEGSNVEISSPKSTEITNFDSVNGLYTNFYLNFSLKPF